MRCQIFSENEWVYPDSEITQPGKAELHCARGGDVCFQVLTDQVLAGGETLQVAAEGLDCETVVYQLLPACVNANSHAKLGVTLDYESVKDFVTRQAPFDVYDITYLPEDGVQKAGRAAFYIRLNVDADAQAGLYAGKITLGWGEETAQLPVSLTIYNTRIPPLEQARLRMINWIHYNKLEHPHNIRMNTDAFMEVLDRYIDNQLDMRNDLLMLPSGVPVRDAQGTVVDFDFSFAERVGNLALKKGYRNILGGFIARWKKWDDAEIYLLWDRDVGVSSIEGFRQQKLYFSRAQECVERNGWSKYYQQCMVDEPQIPNSQAYRAMSAICRRMMPGVIINDPVETQYVGGAVDIWALKQSKYEEYMEEYRKLQAMGEEMWVYTCGYPAGKTMNRALDLPLTASRLPLWMCIKYNFAGFLHWGYVFHTEEYEKNTVIPVKKSDHWGMPPGNGFIVYPGNGKPEYSVRGHLQRAGAQDYELLKQLEDKDPALAQTLIEKLCRSFDDYTTSGALVDQVRRELLEQLG